MTQDDMRFFEDMFRSLEREFHGLAGRMQVQFAEVHTGLDRITVRLDRIAAGAHYVTRLVEWSEKTDQFQMDTLKRLNEMDNRLRKLEGAA